MGVFFIENHRDVNLTLLLFIISKLSEWNESCISVSLRTYELTIYDFIVIQQNSTKTNTTRKQKFAN